MKPPIAYWPVYYKDQAQFFFEAFQKLDWEQRDAPRQEYYCNDVPKPYIYGRGRGQREYLPKPWTPELKEIQADVEALAGARLEVCFLNRYMNQKDQLGWHADNSPEMDDAHVLSSSSPSGWSARSTSGSGPSHRLLEPMSILSVTKPTDTTN